MVDAVSAGFADQTRGRKDFKTWKTRDSTSSQKKRKLKKAHGICCPMTYP